MVPTKFSSGAKCVTFLFPLESAMTSVEILDQVIQAVEETPAKQLSRGHLVDRDGCLCALGAHQYRYGSAEFRAFVNDLRAGKFGIGELEWIFNDEEGGEEPTQANAAYERFSTIAGSPDLANEVVSANDYSSGFGKSSIDETDDERKAVILAALRDLQHAYAVQEAT